MGLIRFAGRALLGGYFVFCGVKTFSDPLQAAAEHPDLTAKLVPSIKDVLPNQLAEKVPDDPKKIIRMAGGAQILGGAMLITGIGYRFGGKILAATLIPHVIEEYDRANPAGFTVKGLLDAELLRTSALLGATVVTGFDPRPMNVNRQARAIERSVAKRYAKAERKANRKAARRKAREFAKQAKTKVAEVVSDVTN